MKPTHSKGVHIVIDPEHRVFVDPTPDYRPPDVSVRAAESPAAKAPPTLYCDREIEDPAKRSVLAPNQGYLSLSVVAGDEQIGDISVSIQFEGPNKQPDACLAGHNVAIEDASAALKGILDRLAPEGTEFSVRFDHLPCPKIPFGIDVQRAVHRLEGRAAERDSRRSVENSREREIP